MNALDTLAGLVLGAFILTVAVKGNSKKMVDLAARDRAFLQWAFAVGVLVYLYNIPALSGAMSLIIVMAFIGLFLVASDKIIPNAQAFWNSLKGN